MESSAVIDMEMLEGDVSDYETNISNQGRTDADEETGQYGQDEQKQKLLEDVKEDIAKNMGSFVWQTGTQKAKQAFSLYGNIDILRPYFDVQPHEVRARLLYSLIPSRPGTNTRVHRELYGPTMVVLTMIALLLYQMKTSGHSVQEGTLMGTAFVVCFGYWFGVSGITWFVSYICNSQITLLQICSLLGYALFGHCIVVGLSTLVHTAHDHMFFYLIWAIFGGLSTLRMISVMTSRTAGRMQRIIVCTSIASLHLLFLLYLHFAYHKIVEDLSYVVDVVEGRHPEQVADGVDTVAKVTSRIVERAIVEGGANKADIGKKIARKALPLVKQVVNDTLVAASETISSHKGNVILNAIGSKLSNETIAKGAAI